MSRQGSRKSRRQSDQPATQNTPQLQMRSFATPDSPQVSAPQTTDLQRKTEAAPESQPNFNFGQLNLLAQETTPPPSPIASPIQAKLTIGQPGDKYEQEADNVAKAVVQQINSPQVAQREEDSQLTPPNISAMVQAAGDDDLMQEKENKAQRKVDPAQAPIMRLPLQRQSSIPVGPANGEFESSLNQSRSGGSALEPNVQAQMESAMGANFSGVKIHTDARADQLSRSIQAKAFTTGQDVFFKQGEYNPGSRGGQELLAHELTHVVQQNGGAVR
ncbi:MAG: DUF4157 domain-containing protein, partial [Cyanobacteria bacterium P01_F01_bin.4]